MPTAQPGLQDHRPNRVSALTWRDLRVGSIRDFIEPDHQEAREDNQIPNPVAEDRAVTFVLPDFNETYGEVLTPFDGYNDDLEMQARVNDDDEDFHEHAEGRCTLPRRWPGDNSINKFCPGCHFMLEPDQARRQLHDPRELFLFLQARRHGRRTEWSPLKGFQPFLRALDEAARNAQLGPGDNMERDGLHFARD